MGTHDLQSVAGELRSLTGKILKAARHDTEKRLSASNAGITPMQYGILQILQNKNYTLSELSNLMERESATLLPAVDTLENKCMLQRCQDPRDRRRNPLTITPQGMSVLERVPQVGESDLLLNALQRLGNEKVEQLIFLLREVSRQVEQEKN
jgi:DNA-binding MarR family transcriptional regulator